MSEPERRSSVSIRWLALAVTVLAAFAAVAGYWLAGWSTPSLGGTPVAATGLANPAKPAVSPTPAAAEPPLIFFVDTRPGTDLAVAKTELKMAVRNGIHRFCVTAPLVWPGQVSEPESALAVIQMVREIDPKAQILLYVNLNPPASWLEAHPDAAARTNDKPQLYASVNSSQWLQAATGALDTLTDGVARSDPDHNVVGYVVAALESGEWYLNDGYDTSNANTEAFQAWLERRYKTDEALQEAWGSDSKALSLVSVPLKPLTTDTQKVFFDLPQMQRNVDYLHFISDSVADAIATVTAHIKDRCGLQTEVFAPYGFSFELLKNDAGHYSLLKLLNSNIDGFWSPVSYKDRGLGGTGGFMGPVDSASYHDKQWFIMDDTRTGISRNATTGVVERIKGLRAEDVYRLQARNYAEALCHKLGLVWTETEPDGRMYDAEMWRRFGVMREKYQSVYAPPVRSTKPPASPPYGIQPSQQTTVCVVVDETSRFYQQCDEPLNARLLTGVRDSALRCGAPAQFCLFRDLLDERAVHSEVYIFCNLFRLSPADRERLQEILQRKKAAAIWMYAPGYIANTASVDNISATTRMNVQAFDGPAKSGSKFVLTGPWMDKDEHFGTPATWNPLFYIQDPRANIICQYVDSGRGSVAIRFLDDGWTSIYVAEPTMTPGLLREILLLLEKHIYFRRTAVKQFDTAYFGPDILAIHAADAGERLVDLNNEYDIQDLLNPDIGWSRKRVFDLMMEAGETRVLRLTPATEGTNP